MRPKCRCAGPLQNILFWLDRCRDVGRETARSQRILHRRWLIIFASDVSSGANSARIELSCNCSSPQRSAVRSSVRARLEVALEVSATLFIVGLAAASIGNSSATGAAGVATSDVCSSDVCSRDIASRRIGGVKRVKATLDAAGIVGATSAALELQADSPRATPPAVAPPAAAVPAAPAPAAPAPAAPAPAAPAPAAKPRPVPKAAAAAEDKRAGNTAGGEEPHADAPANPPSDGPTVPAGGSSAAAPVASAPAAGAGAPGAPGEVSPSAVAAPDPGSDAAHAASPAPDAAGAVAGASIAPAPVAQVVEPESADGSADYEVGVLTPKSSEMPPQDKPSESRLVDDALPPEQLPVPGGLSISLGTQMSFGSSTFQVGAGYTRDPMVDWSVSLAPSYLFGDGTRVSANASLSQELTLSDGDDDPQTVIFSDVGLIASRPIYHIKKGPSFFGALSVQLPTSKSSQVDTLRTSVGARVSASQPVGKIFLSIGTGFRKNFHEFTHPIRDPNTDGGLRTRDGLVVEEVVTGLARTGGSELAGATYFEGESNNTSMVLSNSLSAFWPATERLGLGISYNLTQAWTYDSFPLDEFSGVGAKGGRGRRDSHGGSLFANYQASDSFSFGLGMATGGSTRTADDKRIRFPFYAFEGTASNMTSFFISATYTEAIGL